MSTGTVLALMKKVVMTAMHRRRESEKTSASKVPTIRVNKGIHLEFESDFRRGHEHR